MANSKRAKRSNVPSRKFASMVKKVVDQVAEHKYVESNVVSLPFDAAPAAATLVKSLDQDLIGNIAQGTSAKQRIGDRIKLLSLDFRGVFVPTTANAGAVRLIIGQFRDQTSSSAMTLTQGEVLSLSAGANFSCITSGYDHEPTVNYRMLMDEVITWDAQNTAAPRLIAKHFRNLAVRNRNYEGGTNVYTGGFWYLLLSANGVAATLHYPYAKITYTDV